CSGRPPSPRRRAIRSARLATNRGNRGSPSPAPSPRGPAMPIGTNPAASAPAVGGLFFPQSKRLGIDLGHYSPAVLQQVIFAGVHCTSYELASAMLKQVGGRDVS